MGNKRHKMYVPTHPGFIGIPSWRIRDYQVPFEDFVGGFMPANLPAMLLAGQATGWYGPFGPSTNRWTTTLTGTGAAVANAAVEGGGILFTTGSSSTFNTNLESVMTFPAVTGRTYGGAFRLQVSAHTGIGFNLGFGNSQVLPFTSEYTDFVGIRKAIASGDVYGGAIGNADAFTETSAKLLTMVDAAEIFIGFSYYLDATAPYGQFWYYDSTNLKFVAVEFRAAINTEVGKILTTPPTMYANANFTGVTGTNPTATSPLGVFWMENAY